jgi:asparagine synthase (glutamine-hydrolysing)
MCGLAGLLVWNGINREAVAKAERMLDAIAHRGPDGRATRLFGTDLCMGTVRLSIVDPHGSGQPLQDATGELHLTYNGEIYNYRDLRAELAARGHRFGTDGDGEIILALYREDPEGFAARLDGMFAFALWDDRRRTLMLGRDRCGIKPLFYRATADGLVFASEAKGVLACPEIPLEVDRDAVLDYLRCRFPLPPRSVFAGVRKLPPGSVLTVTPAGQSVRTFWRPEDAAASELPFPEVLGEAVRTTAHGLDPAALFLSGGLDSGTTAALLAGDRAEREHGIQTFSVGYDHGGWEDERAYAREIADHLQVPNHDTLLTSASLPEMFREVGWHLEEPLHTPVTLSTYAVSALAAERHKVAISGDGADELLLGYAHFREAWAVAERNGPWEDRYWESLGWLDAERYKLLVDDPSGGSRRPAPLSEAGGPLDAMRHFEFTAKLVEYHLSRVDRLSMAHGLEVRLPYLRNDVVDWCLARPGAGLLSQPSKRVLRDVVEGLLPASLVQRPKQKFTAPVGLWLAGPLREMARELLYEAVGAEDLGLRPAGVRELARRYDERPDHDPTVTWGVVVLLAWYVHVFDRLRTQRFAHV